MSTATKSPPRLIENLGDLCEYWGVGRDEPHRLNRSIYKYGTDCGASCSLYYPDGWALHNGAESATKISKIGGWLNKKSITWEKPGKPIAFSIQTIVEGSDVEVDGEQMEFGQVTKDDLDTWVKEMEAQAKFYWERDNYNWFNLISPRGTHYPFHQTWDGFVWDGCKPRKRVRDAIEAFFNREGDRVVTYDVILEVPGLKHWKLVEWLNDTIW
jgi:hypothetical protein